VAHSKIRSVALMTCASDLTSSCAVVFFVRSRVQLRSTSFVVFPSFLVVFFCIVRTLSAFSVYLRTSFLPSLPSFLVSVSSPLFPLVLFRRFSSFLPSPRFSFVRELRLRPASFSSFDPRLER